MPAREVGRVENEEQLDELLEALHLLRTSTRGFPQDGQYYLGRDGVSVWFQRGPRAFTSTADLFVVLDQIEVQD